MNLRTFAVTTALLSLWVLFGASPVQAELSAPRFPSCPNPGGTLNISYASGTHGVPGDTTTYTGSDSVYTVGENQLVQCFCPQSGNSGIQTNWWEVGELSQEDIDHFKSLGWVFVPDGSAWGLSQAFYFAYNTSFSCGNTGGGGFSAPGPGSAPVCSAAKPPTPILLSAVQTGSKATLTWTQVTQATHYTIYYGTTPGNWAYSVPNTGKVTSFTIGSLDPSKQYFFEVRAVNDCAPSDPPATGGGQVLGAFAPTGNLPAIFSFVGLGLILAGLSLLVSRRESAKV